VFQDQQSAALENVDGSGVAGVHVVITVIVLLEEVEDVVVVV